MELNAKSKIGVFMILMVVFLLTSCSEEEVIKQSFNQPNTINADQIKTYIERSAMPDGAYRFANLEFDKQYSVYATYYIVEAKKIAGIDFPKMTTAYQGRTLNTFVNKDDIDLFDLYAAISLLEYFSSDPRDPKVISNSVKPKIRELLDKHYDNDNQCYFYSSEENNKNSRILANYLVYQIASLLDIEIKPIDKWLQNAIDDTFKKGGKSKENSSLYNLLYELAIAYKIELPAEGKEEVLTMYKDNIQNLEQLASSNDGFLTVYLMDILDFYRLSGIELSKAEKNSIIKTIIDEDNMLRKDLINQDVLKFYAAVYALNLVEYNFGDNFNDNFKWWDSFNLRESAYITPGKVEPTFVDTFYCYRLIKELNLEIENNNRLMDYCKKNKDTILNSDNTFDVCSYIILLDENALLKIIDDDIDFINKKLKNKFDVIVNKETISDKDLLLLNQLIKAMNILDIDWRIPIDKCEKMISDFKLSDNQGIKTYQLIELIDLANYNQLDESLVKVKCKQLEQEMLNLTTIKMTNKNMLFSKALDSFAKSNYGFSEDLNKAMKTVFLHSQTENGMFLGGDSDEDVISFKNTYYSVKLHQKLYTK